MDIESFRARIADILSESVIAQVYLLIKQDNEYVAKLADLENGKTECEVTKLFKNFVDDTVMQNEDLQMCELSVADERSNALYHYDYEECPEELTVFKNFDIKNRVNNQDKFNFHNDNINNLYGYIIYFGTMENGFVLFKKHYPISLIKRDSFLLGLIKANERFELIQGDDILRLNGDAQLMLIDGEIYVFDTKILEQSIKFNMLINKAADETIEAIDNLGLLEDIQVLRDSAEEISFARKLSKVKKTSPIFSLNIPKETIVQFTKTTKELAGRFKYSDDGQTIRLDTKKSKEAFLKLINDSFLYSKLTKQYYETSTKDKL
ncbi:DUF4868 domain-containing protein [bacterium]|nr:DUF4868 domain-containing protein [bacterium]